MANRQNRKRKKHMASNSLRGIEWLHVKALLCFGHFWQTLTKGEQAVEKRITYLSR